MEFESTTSYTNDTIPMPGTNIFLTMQTWLQNLLESFKSVELPLSDPDVEIDLLLAMGMIRNAQRHLTRTRYACTQYLMLTDLIQILERRLDRASTVATQSYTIWNQLQVYTGVREVFTEYMVRSSNKMVDCCTALDHFNQVLLSHFSLPVLEEQPPLTV